MIFKYICIYCFCFLISCIGNPIVKKANPKIHNAQNNVIRSHVLENSNDGYWLVTRGYHASDNLVSNATGMPLSHVAILDKSNQRVIEADASGIHITPLDSFINKSHRVLILKPRWYTDENGKAALINALKTVGRKYDFLGLIGLNVKDRFYCSELAIHVYNSVIPKSVSFPDVIKPGEMYLYGSIIYDSLPRDEWDNK